jgi:hypothetical protein
MTSQSAWFSRLLAVFLGVLGALGLIAIYATTRRGEWLFVAYGLFIIIIGVSIRVRRIAPFGQRFALALIAFMTASLIDEAYMLLFQNPAALHPPVWPLIWPQMMMLAIGVAASTCVAALSRASLRT